LPYFGASMNWDVVVSLKELSEKDKFWLVIKHDIYQFTGFALSWLKIATSINESWNFKDKFAGKL